MDLTNIQRNSQVPKRNITEVLSEAIVDELNIYNQAFLQLDRPLIKTSVTHQKTKYELPLIFTMDGDYTGNIICLIDTYNKNLSLENKPLFDSLYSESMNILLGKMMTKLDQVNGDNVLISTPKTPKDETISRCIEKHYSHETLSMGYKFISNATEYDCRIIFNINKKKFVEV